MVQTETLLRYAIAGQHHAGWYATAEKAIRIICRRYDWSPKRFADIMALTSPRVQVQRNWAITFHYMRTGQFIPGVMRGIRASVTHYEATGEIRGRKTAPFARALMGDEDALVLDVWMAVALGVDERVVTRNDNRDAATRRVRRVADTLGIRIAAAQAAIWCGVILERGLMPARFEVAADKRIRLHNSPTRPLFGD